MGCIPGIMVYVTEAFGSFPNDSIADFAVLVRYDMMWMKRGKRLLSFLLAIWSSGDRRFKSSHPRFYIGDETVDHLSGPKG